MTIVIICNLISAAAGVMTAATFARLRRSGLAFCSAALVVICLTLALQEALK